MTCEGPACASGPTRPALLRPLTARILDLGLMCGWRDPSGAPAGTPAAWVASAFLALAGCARGEVLNLHDWTLKPPDGGVSIAVHLPAHIDVWLPDRPVTYRLAKQVFLPPTFRCRDLTLAIPSLPGLATLEVDGDGVPALDTPRAGDYRSPGAQRWHIPASATRAEVIDLELAVDYTWTQAGWLDSVPRLSPTPQGDDAFLWGRVFNTVAVAAGFATILLLSCSYWIIFASGKRRRPAFGWFALESLTGAFYPGFVLGLTQPIFGIADAPIMGACLSIATFANVQFVHAHCQLGPPRRAWAYAALASVLAYATVGGGPFTMTYFGWPATVALMATSAVYQVGIMVRLFRGGRPPLHTWIVPLSWPLAFISACADLTAWLGLGEILGGLRMGSLGIGLIALQQSVALSREYILALDQADRLNSELAARIRALETKNKEVSVLNEELRRQIASRSDEFATALSRLSITGLDPGRALSPGDQVEHRYTVLRRIGAGGMGAVYEVERAADGRRLALKLLGGRRGLEELARFAREAKIVSQIHHENVVGIVDMGVTEGGLFYIVMELVEGTSLRAHRARFGDVRFGFVVLSQLARGLAAVHASGVVHRDLKPSNVLLAIGGADGLQVKIADFGISSEPGAHPELALVEVPALGLGAALVCDVPGCDDRAIAAPPAARSWGVQLARLASTEADATPVLPPPAPPQHASGEGESEGEGEGEALTPTGMVLGTPQYMAPELAWGAKHARSSADVYSFGVIAYEVLAGERPFEVPLAVLQLQGKRLVQAPSLAARCPALPSGLTEFLDRCLSLDPTLRPTAAHLADVLTAAAAEVQREGDGAASAVASS